MQTSWLRGAAAAALALSFVACAGVHGVPAPTPSHDRSVLQEQDLRTVERLSAFEALRRLRPAWLSTRGQAALVAPERESVRVYLDDMPLGDVWSLKRIPVRTVGSIRHLDAHDATLVFGVGHAEGAILVTTRHGRVVAGR